MSASGTYCTGGYDASSRVNDESESAITVSPTTTRTRPGVGVTVIGWVSSGISFALLMRGEPGKGRAYARLRVVARRGAIALCSPTLGATETTHDHHRHPPDLP